MSFPYALFLLAKTIDSKKYADQKIAKKLKLFLEEINQVYDSEYLAPRGMRDRIVGIISNNEYSPMLVNSIQDYRKKLSEYSLSEQGFATAATYRVLIDCLEQGGVSQSAVSQTRQFLFALSIVYGITGTKLPSCPPDIGCKLYVVPSDIGPRTYDVIDQNEGGEVNNSLSINPSSRR